MASFVLFAPISGLAADVSVSITDTSNGKPAKDVVVTFKPDAGGDISPADRKGPFVMAQENTQFTPYVLVVPEGATVSFPNNDTISHHVYSFSPAKKFQLPLYGHGISRTMRFEQSGTVALGCNIHDSMQAYIRVVDAPFFAKTDASGQVTFKDVPEGKGSLVVWHPMMAAPLGELKQSLTVSGAMKPLAFSVKLRRVNMLHDSY
jgi:plastocyanin